MINAAAKAAALIATGRVAQFGKQSRSELF
jgi:hypothetical protein